MVIWLVIDSFKGYQVSSDGQVKSFLNNKEGRILKVYKDKKGYRYVTLYKDGKPYRKKVSRLVAKAFPDICGEWFEGCTIDHINTIRDDDRAENLKVCTLKENINNPLTKHKQKKYYTEEEKRLSFCRNSKKWNSKNKERVKESQKKWRDSHPDYQRQYYLNHKKAV